MTRTRKALGLLEAARELDGQVKAVARRRNADKIVLARLLLEMHEQNLASALGFESVAAYAEAAIEQRPSTTRQLLALARKLRDEPELARVAESGELPWTTLRTIAGAATSENVGAWIEKARELPRDELERQAREERGERPVERVVLEVSREDFEDLQLAVQAVWRERPELSFGAALAEVCRQVVRGGGVRGGGEGGNGASSTTRLVLHTCDSCEKTTRETRTGPLEVKPASAARAACDAEVLDIREGPAAVRRAIAPKVANFIDARDKARCRVPGCTNRVFLELHHEGPGGWRAVGHSPEHVLTLCSAHHVARHEGRLTIEGDANATLTFRLADGTELGADRRRAPGETGAVSRETLVPVSPETKRAAPRGAPLVATVEAALRSLAFTAAEVRQRMAVALASVGPGASVEALTLAALRAG